MEGMTTQLLGTATPISSDDPKKLLNDAQRTLTHAQRYVSRALANIRDYLDRGSRTNHERQQGYPKHSAGSDVTFIGDRGSVQASVSLNADRRQLTRVPRRALVAESIKADPQLSDREHGRRVGANHKTVGAIRRDLEANGEIRPASR